MVTISTTQTALRLQKGLRAVRRRIHTITMWGTTGMSGFLIGVTSTFLYVWLETAYWVNDINYIAQIMPFIATTAPAARTVDCLAKGVFVIVGWIVWIKHATRSTQPNNQEDLK